MGHVVVIPRYGPFGASLVTAAVACMGMGIGLVTVRRLWQVVPPLGTVARTLAASLLALIVSMVWPASGAMVLVKMVAVTGLVIGVYWALREFTADETALVRELIGEWTKTSKPADTTATGLGPESPIGSEGTVGRGTLAP
jgi:peptidoglycan biosynthesis protein MviN/MurJ (putative lipid II flippase)